MKPKIKLSLDSALTQQCYEHLQNEIVSGAFKPGEKLKITALKKHFSVGQTPIREALSQLLQTGLVTFEENKGFRVAPISEADIQDTYEILTMIEINALRLSLERGDVEWEAQLVAAYHKLSLVENMTDKAFWPTWAEPNYLFHRALIAGCASPILLEIQKMLYIKFDRYARIAYQISPEITTTNYGEEKRDDHKELVELALKRDIKKSVALMKTHISVFFEDIIKTLKAKKVV